MFNADVLTFQEFMAHEPIPLSQIHGAVLEFLQGREDVVLFGAHAVNAYVPEPRMTQDVDLLSTRAADFAEELRSHLGEKFEIATRVRKVAGGKGFRVFQRRKEGIRHLVDIRSISAFPSTEVIESIVVISPTELIASKVISYHSRYGQSKSWTDRRDLAVLLLRFPELKSESGEVLKALQQRGANQRIFEIWNEIVGQELIKASEDEDLEY